MKLGNLHRLHPKCDLHILGVSESRWTGSGKIKTNTGETVLYSGRDDNHHYEGVAIILKKGTEKGLIEWKPVNSRLKGVHTNMTLIQCYVPTNHSDEAIHGRSCKTSRRSSRKR